MTETGRLSSFERVSRDGHPTTHRFYDTSAVSPSGAFIALTELPYEDRLPSAGDEAAVVVRSITSGQEVYRTATAAWESQLGAQAQWGATDAELFFNRMDTTSWSPYGVRVDPASGAEFRLDRPVYMVAASGRFAVSPDLRRMWWAQPGYGVTVPEAHRGSRLGVPDDDGVFLTDLTTGSSRLLVSLRQISDAFPEHFGRLRHDEGGLVGFHVKVSPDESRIMFLVRWLGARARQNHTKNWIVTMGSDGSDLKIALGPERWTGGHHPNWCPDSRTIIMNLMFKNDGPWPVWFGRTADRVLRKLRLGFRFEAESLGLALFDSDGGDPRRIGRRVRGSGHPSVLASGFVLTDAYPSEPVAAGDGTAPIRLISPDDGNEEQVAVFRTRPDFDGPNGEWRVDPHPALTRDGSGFVVNSYQDGYRAVYLATFRGEEPRR